MGSELAGISSFSLSKGTVLEVLQKCEKLPHGYSIANIYQSTKIIVGSITSVENTNVYTVNITNAIIFLGNVTVISPNSRAKITLSIANGIHGPYYPTTYPDFQYLFLGAFYAVSRSNLLEEVPNFYFELFPTDCGIFLYDPYWYYNCFAPVASQMGVALITSFYSDAIRGNILTLRALGLNLPEISPLNTEDALLSKTENSELLALASSLPILQYNMVYTLKSLEYTDIVLIRSNETETTYEYYRNLENAILEN